MANSEDHYITVDSDKEDDDLSSDEDSVYSSSTTSSSCDRPLTVYVGKFPHFINEGQLQSHFQQFSQSITKVTIVRDKETKYSKGFAFIHFNSDEVADRAIISLNCSKLLDKYVINVRNKNERHSQKGRVQSRQPSIEVWVGNISADTTKEDLSLHFAAFKENMKPIRDLQQSKGSDKVSSQFAFLLFTSFESAKKAILTMNGTMLKKRKLRVQLSESKKKQLNPPQASPTETLETKIVSLEPQKPASTMIVLTNFPSEIDNSDLQELIEGYGTVLSLQSNDTGNGTRTVSITFGNSEEAAKVAEKLNGQTFFGKVISVKRGALAQEGVIESSIKVTFVHSSATEDDLITYFSTVGHVTWCKIFEPQKKSDTRYARIKFSGEDTAANAKAKFDGKPFFGQNVNVSVQSTTCLIHVHDIGLDVTSAQVFNVFKKYGKIIGNVEINDGPPRYACVNFSSMDVAQKAVSDLNNSDLNGSKIHVCIPTPSMSSPLSKDFVSSSNATITQKHTQCKSKGQIRSKFKPPGPSLLPLRQPSIQSTGPVPHQGTNFSQHGSMPLLSPLPSGIAPSGPRHPGYAQTPTVPICYMHQAPAQYPSRMDHAQNSLTFKQPMSQQLYDLFTKSVLCDVAKFQQRGGTLNYHQGNVILQAKSYDELMEFRSLVLSQYTEKSFICSPSQWNQLVVVNECGIRKMDELKSPFTTNPNLMIFEKPPLNLEFVGTIGAVTSAYDHFVSALNKELPVDRVKLQALQLLHPEVCQEVMNKFQVVLTFGSGSITLNGVPQNIHSARCEVEQLLLQIQVGVLPPLKYILYLSLKKRLSTLGEQVVIIDDTRGSRNVCCTSKEILQQVHQISQSLSQREVYNISSSVQQELCNNYSKDVEDIERNHLVEITWEEQKAILRGFVISDLNSAKLKLLGKVKSLNKERRYLQCPPLIAIFIHHVLFNQEQSSEVKAFVSGLKVKLASQNNTVYIEGADNLITEEEKKVINFFAPPELLYKAFSYDSDCRFILQIISACLRDLHKQCQFTHLITRHSKCYPTPERSITPTKAVSGCKHSSSSETEWGFTVAIYSTNIQDFEHVCTVLEALSPCMEEFSIPPRSADHVLKIKGQLEKKHSVRISVNKLEKVSVIIHGVRDSDISMCRETLEGSLFDSRKIYINCCKAIYLETKCSNQIEEYRKRCQKFSMPPPLKESDNLSEKCFIRVIGRSSDVESVCYDVEKILNNFTVEMFPITCPQFMFSTWKRRWSQVKNELEESHDVVISFSQSSGPQVGRRGNSQIKSTPLQSSEDVEVVINFAIFGPNKDNVTEVRKILEEKENGLVITKIIPIKKDYPFISHPGVLVKSLALDRFMIWLKVEGNQLCLCAPCTATTDLDEANIILLNYFEQTSTKSDIIEYVDDVIGEVLHINGESILKEAIAAAKCHKVVLNFKKKPITLTGSQAGINIVKRIVETALEQTRACLDICQLSIDSLKVPYLQTCEFKQFLSKAKRQHCVFIKQPFCASSKANKVISQSNLQPSSLCHCLKVSIIKGTILSENVDAIVNSANKDLQHNGGLAKAILDAGGPSIQSESTRYVEENGRVKAGNAVCLGAGMLPVKHVIHAVAPRWKGGMEGESNTLYNTILNICKCADVHNLSSIAIPALGTGNLGVPSDVCAQAYFTALSDFCKSTQSSSLCDIRLVLSLELVPLFQKYFDNHCDLSSTSPASSIDTVQSLVQWSFQNDQSTFQPYTIQDSQQLESWYQTGTTGVLNIGNFNYSFDFTTMTQCNTQTGKIRVMKRTPQDDLVASPQAPVVLTLHGPKEGVKMILILLQNQLDHCISKEELKISFSSGALEDTLHKIATQYNIEVEIQPRKESKVAVLRGVTHLVKDALSDMRECLINHMETSGTKVQIPTEWQPQSHTTELFNVTAGSVEYSHVIGRFMSTMPNVNIVSVQRVQNLFLWDKFIHHKGMIEQKNGGQANEMELFHGTRGNNPQLIYDSEEGFDMRFSASGMWGQANYFAVNASYSNNYAHTLTNSQKQMFLVKVLTGASYNCSPNSTLRMPPEKPSHATAGTGIKFSQVRYDTVSGTTGGSNVYMTYDNLKAYPAYLITYY